MLRPVSSRNQRSKGGFKMKNAAQICLLVVICFWLLYQMQHSHDEKSFEERASRDISNSEDTKVESARFGRKVLPGIIESNPMRVSQTVEKDKESLKTIGQAIKYENENEKEGISGQQMDTQDQGRTQESITDAENKNKKGVSSVVLEDQENDDSSHEAREKSFRGDDASSEVFHNSHVPEHEEASHEAQERRFNGDDASSAVEHITTGKESESAEDISFKGGDRSNVIEIFTKDQESESAEEINFRSDDGSSVLEHFTKEKESESENGAGNLDEKLLENIAMLNREAEDASRVDSRDDSNIELLDTFDGSNSSSIKGENDSPVNSTTAVINALGAKEQELAPAMLKEISPLGAMHNDTNTVKEQYPEIKATDAKQQRYPNSDGNQTENAADSTDESKDQFNLKINSSSLSQGHIRAEVMLVNLTYNVTYPQDQGAISHTPQAQNELTIIKIPGENFSLVSEASDVPQKSDISANVEEGLKSSKAPSTTNDDGEAVPLETNLSSPTGDQKETHGDNYPSNLQTTQNQKVEEGCLLHPTVFIETYNRHMHENLGTRPQSFTPIFISGIDGIDA